MSKIIKFIKSTIIETDILLLLLCIGASVFGLIMVHSATTLRITEDALVSRDTRTMIIAGLSSILGALTMGFADNIWYNYRVFIMFWIVVALTVALTKTNVRERESTRIIANMTSADLEINR